MTRSKRASSSLTLAGPPLSLHLLLFVFGTKGTSSICSSAVLDDRNSICASTRSWRVRSRVDSTCTSAPVALTSSVCVRASATLSMVCVAYFASSREEEDVDCALGGRSAWNEMLHLSKGHHNQGYMSENRAQTLRSSLHRSDCAVGIQEMANL